MKKALEDSLGDLLGDLRGDSLMHSLGNPCGGRGEGVGRGGSNQRIPPTGTLLKGSLSLFLAQNLLFPRSRSLTATTASAATTMKTVGAPKKAMKKVEAPKKAMKKVEAPKKVMKKTVEVPLEKWKRWGKVMKVKPNHDFLSRSLMALCGLR